MLLVPVALAAPAPSSFLPSFSLSRPFSCPGPGSVPLPPRAVPMYGTLYLARSCASSAPVKIDWLCFHLRDVTVPVANPRASCSFPLALFHRRAHQGTHPARAAAERPVA